MEFKSGGGKGELDQAAALASLIAPGTTILKLRDRDDLTSDSRARLLADEVLETLVDDRGARVDNAANELKAAREGAIRANGSMKGALGVVFNAARSVLRYTEGLGENASQFSADVLAKLITPEMEVRRELEAVLDLP